jgi:hypothetical protein
MSILVAFLVVARVQIMYGRYMEARQYLTQCFKTFTELIQSVSVLTMRSNHVEAKEWRLDVAVACVTTLRITVAAIEVSFFLFLFGFCFLSEKKKKKTIIAYFSLYHLSLKFILFIIIILNPSLKVIALILMKQFP